MQSGCPEPGGPPLGGASLMQEGFCGLVAYDSDYALSNIPYFFSAHALKLNRNSKSLTTSQYLMHEVSQELSLDPKCFIIFASLLENQILPEEDLAAFHWNLLGPDHPLACLKVRAHQLVLPPCDVVIKAVAEYARNIPDITSLEAIAKDILRYTQSCPDDRVVHFLRTVEYYSEASQGANFSPQIGGFLSGRTFWSCSTEFCRPKTLLQLFYAFHSQIKTHGSVCGSTQHSTGIAADSALGKTGIQRKPLPCSLKKKILGFCSVVRSSSNQSSQWSPASLQAQWEKALQSRGAPATFLMRRSTPCSAASPNHTEGGSSSTLYSLENNEGLDNTAK
ncbi:hypothetical protein CHARACLAT_029803 [Characodon lateralis]|uniref:Uncharacterized protein n=1 Tax=Characodon lateralis TaxID=208331 RepID=A0ABU7EDZ2_9TELE|nr:hypothetical protein [Characodon lateralis]